MRPRVGFTDFLARSRTALAYVRVRPLRTVCVRLFRTYTSHLSRESREFLRIAYTASRPLVERIYEYGYGSLRAHERALCVRVRLFDPPKLSAIRYRGVPRSVESPRERSRQDRTIRRTRTVGSDIWRYFSMTDPRVIVF